MAAKVRYLIERDGRYHARVVVAKRLRPILKKVELSVALGADRREALRKLPRAVAQFQEQIAEAERRLSESERATAPPIAFDAVRAARALYDNSVAFDSELRDATPLYSRFGHPDEAYIEDLKSIAAGRLRDNEMPRIFLTNIRQHVPAGLDHAAWSDQDFGTSRACSDGGKRASERWRACPSGAQLLEHDSPFRTANRGRHSPSFRWLSYRAPTFG